MGCFAQTVPDIFSAAVLTRLDEHPCCSSHRNIKIVGGRKYVQVQQTNTQMPQSTPCVV
jgi:hypothetical protein